MLKISEPLTCETVQIQVAWGRSFSEAQQLHILECPDCGQLALEYAELDSALAPYLHAPPVPEGFAARVMAELPRVKPVAEPSRFQWSFIKLGLVSACLALVSLVFAPSAGGAERRAGLRAEGSFAASRRHPSLPNLAKRV